MYLGGGCCKLLCARYECPEIRMSPRILVAIKRRPAVSPSAYGTECRWRLEKAIFWNAGNAVCTGPEGYPSPSADSSLPSPSVHTGATPPALGISWASLASLRPCPALRPQGCPLGVPERGSPGLPPAVAESLPLPGAQLPRCSSSRDDSPPSPDPGHCEQPQRPGRR